MLLSMSTFLVSIEPLTCSLKAGTTIVFVLLRGTHLGNCLQNVDLSYGIDYQSPTPLEEDKGVVVPENRPSLPQENLSRLQ